MSSVDTIVHFGAGRCSELKGYLAQQPHRILLVEADSELTEELLRRTKDIDTVQVICAAIASEAGSRNFNIYNLPDANSLHSPSELKQLYPGLKTVKVVEVDAISPDALLAPLLLNAENDNLLVIDIPGEELPVLKTLKHTQSLYLFSQLVVHCGCQRLYEGNDTASQVIAWLGDAGFDLIDKDDSFDPDRPRWVLKRNLLHANNRELQDQLALSEKKTRESLELSSVLSDQVETLTESLRAQKSTTEEQEAIIAGLKNHLSKMTVRYESSEKVVAQLTQSRDKQLELVRAQQAELDQMTAEHDEISKSAAKLETQLLQVTEARDALEKLSTQRQAEIAELKHALDAQAKASDERQAKLDQMRLERDEISKSAARLETQLLQATEARDALEKLSKQRQVEMEEFTKDREKRAQVANEQQLKLEQIIRERDKLVGSVFDLKEQLAQVTEAQDKQLKQLKEEQSKKAAEIATISRRMEADLEEQTRLAADRLQKNEQLIEENKGLGKKANDLMGLVKQLKDECGKQSEVTAARELELEHVNKELENNKKHLKLEKAQTVHLKKLLKETERNKKKAEVKLSEGEEKKQLFIEEMNRAEGQLKILKELVALSPTE